jgi:type VI secretion system protein ImpC
MPTNPPTLTVDDFLTEVLRSLLPPDAIPSEKPLALLATPPAAAAAGASAQDIRLAKDRARAHHILRLMGVLLCNVDYALREEGDGGGDDDRQLYFVDKKAFADLLGRLNELAGRQLNEVFHQPELRELEATWRSISDLVDRTNFGANIGLSLLDAAKTEIGEDMAANGADIAASELFKKVYTAEYDQLGGEPYAALIGLYELENTYDDRAFLKGMASLCKASHAPFVAAASPRLFGVDDMTRLMEIRDVSASLDEAWTALRELEEFAYIGLTLPRYVVRRPYRATDAAGGPVRFREEPPSPDHEAMRYVWGNAAMLFARNLVRSFEGSGWCQYIRGVKGGGYLEGLARVALDGADDELRPPVEVVIPDYGELALANAGFIPLVYKKGSSDAVFFSSQAMKRPQLGTDPHVSENSQLTTNLAYTFSISRIAHYLKRMMRNNVGSSADGNYVQAQIDAWIARYVTTIVNPDDLTLRYYPFKAYSLKVAPIEGRIGWYDCNLTIQPHIQFEGMDVTLRVDARLS